MAVGNAPASGRAEFVNSIVITDLFSTNFAIDSSRLGVFFARFALYQLFFVL